MPTVSGVSHVHLEEDVRTTLVDPSGNPYTPGNPLPTTSGGAGSPFVVITDPDDAGRQAAVTDADPASNAFGAVVRVAGSVPFSATDLDIRDLVFATDKVDVSGSTIAVDFPDSLAVFGTNAFSTVNSSVTPLTGGATFTGAYEEISDYVSVSVIVNTDSVAVSDALHFDFSTDGTNLDRSVAVDVVVGGDWASLPAKAKFFRIRLIAGGAAQTYLRLQTHYAAIPEGNKMTPLIDKITDASSASLVRAVIEGHTTAMGGGYVPVKVTPSGSLTADVTGTVAISGTVPISVASLPLPAGAATSANQQTDALTNAQLRAADVLVADDYDSDILTTDQTGAGAVLTFSLGGPVKLVAVDVDVTDPMDTDTYICRVSLDGSTPTSARGWRCRSGQTTYLPVPSAGTVLVFAPVGVYVSVQAGARA